MGTHSRTGLEKTIFGSVCDKVIKSAVCPVFVHSPQGLSTYPVNHPDPLPLGPPEGRGADPMISSYTIGFSTHRLESLPFARQEMLQHEVIVLEEPPSPALATVLHGETEVEEYIWEMDAEFPEFGRRQLEILRELWQQKNPSFRLNLIWSGWWQSMSYSRRMPLRPTSWPGQS